jgi:hypothetical protein
LHATLLEIAHLSVGVGDDETTCRFEPDSAINLPRRSTGSAQLPVVGQATGKPGTFRYARGLAGLLPGHAATKPARWDSELPR